MTDRPDRGAFDEFVHARVGPLAGALTVLYGLRWLWRRRTGLF